MDFVEPWMIRSALVVGLLAAANGWLFVLSTKQPPHLARDRPLAPFRQALPLTRQNRSQDVGPRLTKLIRGGIVGDAFTRSLPTPAPAAQPPAATRAPATSRPEPEAPLVGPSAESELDLR